MRGKVFERPGGFVEIRITPAYAGKSFVSFFHCTTFWDHPRVCGEKVRPTAAVRGVRGSPPHVRGKVKDVSQNSSSFGITPAYAGKSCRPEAAVPDLRDHPRVCGEKIRGYVKIWNEWGSPPRMRGKGCAARLYDLRHGITPAYAGKRPFRCPARRRNWDHPRVCGEKPPAGDTFQQD